MLRKTVGEVNTHSRTFLSIPVLVAVLFLSQTSIYAQINGAKPQSSNKVSRLAEEKMEISKLDWVMMLTRLRILESKAAHGTNQGKVSPLGAFYDRDKGTVVIRGFVDSDWIGRAKLQEVKDTLTSEALTYCTEGLLLAEGELDSWAVANANIKEECVVHFFTWEIKSGQLERKDIAKFQSGNLVLD